MSFNCYRAIMALGGLASIGCTIAAVAVKNVGGSTDQIRDSAISAGVTGLVSLVAACIDTNPNATRSGAVAGFTTGVVLAFGLGIGMTSVGGIGLLGACVAGGLGAFAAITNGVESYNPYNQNNPGVENPLLAVSVHNPPTAPTLVN